MSISRLVVGGLLASCYTSTNSRWFRCFSHLINQHFLHGSTFTSTNHQPVQHFVPAADHRTLNQQIIIHQQSIILKVSSHTSSHIWNLIPVHVYSYISEQFYLMKNHLNHDYVKGVVAMTTQLTTKKKPMLIILAVRRVLWWANPLLSISCWEMTSPTPTNEPADRRWIQIPP